MSDLKDSVCLNCEGEFGDIGANLRFCCEHCEKYYNGQHCDEDCWICEDALYV